MATRKAKRDAVTEARAAQAMAMYKQRGRSPKKSSSAGSASRIGRTKITRVPGGNIQKGSMAKRKAKAKSGANR